MILQITIRPRSEGVPEGAWVVEIADSDGDTSVTHDAIDVTHATELADEAITSELISAYPEVSDLWR